MIMKKITSYSLQTTIEDPEDLLIKSKVFADIGEYLLAVLILYRAADLATVEIIKKEGTFSDWSTGVFSLIKNEFLNLREQLYLNRKLPTKLGFSDSLVVTHILYPGIITFPLLKQILDLAEIRHRTWITHGYNTPTRSDYTRVSEVFVPVIRQLISEK